MRIGNIPANYTPSPTEVKRYIEKWYSLEGYVNQENALDLLFVQLCPKNETIEPILIKIAALNDFYSTNIYDVHTVAKHFMTLDIDKRLAEGDELLVDQLSHVILKGKKYHFYSFATKFCSHHNPSSYPIYDKYVGDILRFFRRRDKFSNFRNEDLLIYPRFKSIVSDFRAYYGLNDFGFKQIDQYIWQLGKEYYKKAY